MQFVVENSRQKQPTEPSIRARLEVGECGQPKLLLNDVPVLYIPVDGLGVGTLVRYGRGGSHRSIPGIPCDDVHIITTYGEALRLRRTF